MIAYHIAVRRQNLESPCNDLQPQSLFGFLVVPFFNTITARSLEHCNFQDFCNPWNSACFRNSTSETLRPLELPSSGLSVDKELCKSRYPLQGSADQGCCQSGTPQLWKHSSFRNSCKSATFTSGTLQPLELYHFRNSVASGTLPP